ncbi:MAG TPA: thiamine-phosphate kinase [Thermomicrobiales bacterium]|nr:thiamine-phosphate kinase [Thermomicrobiales bacterium]
MDAEPGATGTAAALGEFALIDRLAAALAEVGAGGAPAPSGPVPSEVLGVLGGDLLGIGDDAAAWWPAPGARALITTDSLIAGVHFRLDWTGWRDLGHKALAVNVSDIAAMGGRPRLAVVSLGLTGREPVAGLLDLYRGLGALAVRHGLTVAGGDVVRSPDRLGLHVTVVGESWPDLGGRILTRAGARPGDALAVSGPLGSSAAGLALLAARTDGGAPVDLAAVGATEGRALLAAHLRPEPRVALGRLLVEAGARAAMDLSDGLFGDLAKVCAASGVAALVEEAALPVPAAVRSRFPDRWLDLATRGGEDYELLFAAPPAVLDDVAARCRAAGLPIPARIGAVLPAGDAGPRIVLRRADGTDEVVRGGAFDHFGG